MGVPSHLPLRERVERGELLGPRIITSGPSLNGNTVPRALGAGTSLCRIANTYLTLGERPSAPCTRPVSRFFSAPMLHRCGTFPASRSIRVLDYMVEGGPHSVSGTRGRHTGGRRVTRMERSCWHHRRREERRPAPPRRQSARGHEEYVEDLRRGGSRMLALASGTGPATRRPPHRVMNDRGPCRHFDYQARLKLAPTACRTSRWIFAADEAVTNKGRARQRSESPPQRVTRRGTDPQTTCQLTPLPHSGWLEP